MIDFKDLNNFIDKRNLDEIQYYLMSTRALSKTKSMELLLKNINDSQIEDNFNKVEIFF